MRLRTTREPSLEKGPTLSAFTREASSRLPGSPSVRARRATAWEGFDGRPLPSPEEDDWRYSPVDRLDLDAHRPVLDPPPEQPWSLPASLQAVAEGASVKVEVRAGWPGALPPAPEGVHLAVLSRAEAGDAAQHPVEEAGTGRSGGEDALDALHGAFSPDTLLVEVAPGAVVTDPVFVHHSLVTSPPGTDGTAASPASFPRIVVRLGRASVLQLIEVFTTDGDGGALLLPRTELAVGEGAQLSYVSMQIAGPRVWNLGGLSASVERDATLSSFTVGLGGEYDRLATRASVVGRGASSRLRSVYLGSAGQVHDVRTLQDHAAPSTTSDLLCKGAVAGSARSIYTGLIRIRPGAVHSDAQQSNHNVVLGEHAHADSIPNLDIQENDVRCSHASSVGPVDDDQLYYLESRGIRPDRAERLIVLGFFEDIIDRCPVPPLRPALRQEIGERADAALRDLQQETRGSRPPEASQSLEEAGR